MTELAKTVADDQQVASPLPMTYASEPLVIENVTASHWDNTCDVLVVGYGGAGVSAAIEAASQGASVLAVDRFHGGGATALSGGVVYAGATRHQKQGGYEDSVEAMYQYLKMEIGDVVKDETLRRFCETSNENLQWLEEHGVEFGDNVYSGKMTYPPAGYDIYFSGNEKVPDYAAAAKPAPRGHRAVGEKYTGHVFFERLRESALRMGVRFQPLSRVTRLIVDAGNAVVGAEVSVIDPLSPAAGELAKIMKGFNTYGRFFASTTRKAMAKIAALEESAGKTIRVRATKGVILSTGSFAFNHQMIETYAPKFIDIVPLGAMGCDGSGIALGYSVGGALGRMDSVTAWRSISPPVSFVKGIAVNREGKRFVTEDTYVGRLGHEIALQPDCKAWVLIDKQLHSEAFKSALQISDIPLFEFSGALHQIHNLLRCTTKGKTLDELAGKCGIDADGLQATVAHYNETMEKGVDDFGKNTDYHRRIGSGPYYALDISITNRRNPLPSIPMGGLYVNEETGEVRDRDGKSISGLYAAGRAAVGIPSGFYVSGSSLADCVFSGRRAAAHAVARSE